MNDFFTGLGGFAKDVASAAATAAPAFKDESPEDKKKAKALGEWDWKPIAFALGGVVVVVFLLRFALKR